MKRKKAGKKDGSAIVVAVVIMMLVMMLSLALLLACYSLRQSAVRQRTMEQCKEIAQGVSKELTAEITHEFNSSQEVSEALKGTEYPLWSYLRCNIWQSSWPYYNEDETRHQEAEAYKYFTLKYTGAGAGEMPGTVTVVMHWESDRDESKVNGIITPFFIEVTCQIGELKSTITSEYELHIEPDKSGYTKEDVTPESKDANPENNIIQRGEQWKFDFIERE